MDKIKQKIQELCPDICERKFYIEAFRNPEDAEKWINNFQNLGSVEIIPVKEIEEYGHTSTWCKVEILGSPITLAVVLRAIGMRTQFIAEPYALKYLILRDSNRNEAKWNLENDNYDLQSEETKKFIGEILNVN